MQGKDLTVEIDGENIKSVEGGGEGRYDGGGWVWEEVECLFYQ